MLSFLIVSHYLFGLKLLERIVGMGEKYWAQIFAINPISVWPSASKKQWVQSINVMEGWGAGQDLDYYNFSFAYLSIGLKWSMGIFRKSISIPKGVWKGFSHCPGSYTSPLINKENPVNSGLFLDLISNNHL